MSLAALLPTMPEIRYLLARVLLRPPIRPRFIMAWSLWRRQHQAKAAERTVEGLWTAIGRLIETFTPGECINYFAAARYDAT